MGYKNVGNAVYIIKFVVRAEGLDFFNEWYNTKHLKWAVDVFGCQYGSRFEATHSAYETRTYYSLYFFESKEAMDIGLQYTGDRNDLIDDLYEIRKYVVAEEFNPAFEILSYFPEE